MRRTFDLVVIGGGVAGTAAALAAASAGARTALVRAGPGATALTSGAWVGGLPEILGRALASAGIAYEPCARALPHPSGELRASDHAPALQAAARVDDGGLVCGIAGLGGFHAPALARLWGDGCGADVRSVTVRLDGTPHAGWSPVALAAAIERNPLALARSLAAAVREHRPARVVLPAVLGFTDPLGVASALRSEVECDVTEALAAPPSIPGWRLTGALERALRTAAVEVIAGRAVMDGGSSRTVGAPLPASPRWREQSAGAGDASRSGSSPGERVLHATRRSIERLRVDTAADGDGAGQMTLTAAAYVLATGKFAGGGISADASFRETALGCPVWVDAPGRRFGSVEPLVLTSPQRLAPQPILAAGVRTDEAGRPIDQHDGVVYENVWSAGSVRAGMTTAELGLGAAAEDGARAAVHALEHH